MSGADILAHDVSYEFRQSAIFSCHHGKAAESCDHESAIPVVFDKGGMATQMKQAAGGGFLGIKDRAQAVDSRGGFASPRAFPPDVLVWGPTPGHEVDFRRLGTAKVESQQKYDRWCAR